MLRPRAGWMSRSVGQIRRRRVPTPAPTHGRRKIPSMESPTLARQSVSAEVSEFARAELEAFVALSKRQRPYVWSRVEHLQQACRRESPVTYIGLTESVQVLAEAGD